MHGDVWLICTKREVININHTASNIKVIRLHYSEYRSIFFSVPVHDFLLPQKCPFVILVTINFSIHNTSADGKIDKWINPLCCSHISGSVNSTSDRHTGVVFLVCRGHWLYKENLNMKHFWTLLNACQNNDGAIANCTGFKLNQNWLLSRFGWPWF